MERKRSKYASFRGASLLAGKLSLPLVFGTFGGLCWGVAALPKCCGWGKTDWGSLMAVLAGFALLLLVNTRLAGRKPDRLISRDLAVLLICSPVVMFVWFWFFAGTAFLTAWFWTELRIGNLTGVQWLLFMLGTLVLGVGMSSGVAFVPFWMFYRLVRGVETPLRKQLKIAGLLAFSANVGIWALGVAAAFCWHVFGAE